MHASKPKQIREKIDKTNKIAIVILFFYLCLFVCLHFSLLLKRKNRGFPIELGNKKGKAKGKGLVYLGWFSKMVKLAVM